MAEDSPANLQSRFSVCEIPLKVMDSRLASRKLVMMDAVLTVLDVRGCSEASDNFKCLWSVFMSNEDVKRRYSHNRSCLADVMMLVISEENMCRTIIRPKLM